MVKKSLSVLLAILMLFSCGIVAFAKAPASATAPLVIISGFGTVPLYDYDTKKPNQVFLPETGTIVSNVAKVAVPLTGSILKKDWLSIAGNVNKAALGIFGKAACDEKGNSIYNVNVRKFPGKAVNYPDFYDVEPRDEQGFIKTAIETLGADRTYFFSYDWRMDPMDHAKDLNAFIKDVLKESGEKQVILAACSMGGTVLMSYLYQFGSKDVQSCILDNTAYQGITFVGELLSLDIAVEKKALVEYLIQFANMDDSIKNFLIRLLTSMKLVDGIVDFASVLLDESKYKICEEVIVPLFAQMPGMWAFVGKKEYENAKKTSLDPKVHADLIKKIDNYHYNVQCNAKKLLRKAMNNGTIVVILANYGKRAIPMTKSMDVMDDYLIDTSLSSGGAVCADYGKTLPENYKQKKHSCGHNHLSPDNMLDASTCMFPEITWFVKDMGHLDYPNGSEGADFLMWLVSCTKQPNIRTNPDYPQFMQFNKKAGTLKPMAS